MCEREKNNNYPLLRIVTGTTSAAAVALWSPLATLVGVVAVDEMWTKAVGKGEMGATAVCSPSADSDWWFLIEAAGWSASSPSSLSSAIVMEETGLLIWTDDSIKLDTEPTTSGGGFRDIRRRGAAGKLARLLLTGPDGLEGAERSGRVDKHWATLTPLSFKMRLVSSNSWCSFSHLRWWICMWKRTWEIQQQ